MSPNGAKLGVIPVLGNSLTTRKGQHSWNQRNYQGTQSCTGEENLVQFYPRDQQGLLCWRVEQETFMIGREDVSSATHRIQGVNTGNLPILA